MSEAEMLMSAMDRLTATVETLEKLKNLTMREWLVAVTKEGDLPPLRVRPKAIGNG